MLAQSAARYASLVPLRHDAKIDLLKRVPLFAGCSKQELRRIASITDEVDLKEGTELTREGERGREFFVLLEGTVGVEKGGKSRGTRGEGDFIGEIALVTQAPRTATVTAKTPVRALVVTGRDFRGLLRETPQIQMKVLQALADRLAADAV